MTASRIVDRIFRDFAARGGRMYGEEVTEREHALQAALFARGYGEPDALVAACLRVADHPVHVLGTGGLPVHEEFVALCAYADVEERLEVPEVLVVGTEERLHAVFGDCNALDCFYLLLLQ